MAVFSTWSEKTPGDVAAAFAVSDRRSARLMESLAAGRRATQFINNDN
jgi:hypothetical protein